MILTTAFKLNEGRSVYCKKYKTRFNVDDVVKLSKFVLQRLYTVQFDNKVVVISYDTMVCLMSQVIDNNVTCLFLVSNMQNIQPVSRNPVVLFAQKLGGAYTELMLAKKKSRTSLTGFALYTASKINF